MKYFLIVLLVLCLCGCEGFRYAATEAQKQNAWLHSQVCAAAADTAVEENASPALCDLTELAHDQSTAFVLDYGVPELFTTGYPHGQAELDRATLHEADVVFSQAQTDSLRKPDVFELADGVLELGIAVAGLVGGVYGIRIAGYLKEARDKSKALKEIIAGNELFKQLCPEQADRFKRAQKKQSPATRRIVTEMKAN
jgi:hypothetical protein